MGSVISETQAAKWLADIHAGPNFLAIFPTQDPFTHPGAELAGGNYARRPITFSAPSSKSVVSTNGPVFYALAKTLVSYLAVMSARTGGFCRFRVDISGNPFEVDDSGVLVLAPGDVALTL